MSKLIILVGNIGSGKSTISRKFYKQGFLVVNADTIRTMLGGGEYVFDFGLEDKFVHKVVEFAIDKLFELKKDFLVDETMVKRKYRTSLIKKAKDHGYEVIGVVMPNWGKDVQVDRRMASEPRGYTRESWADVWEKIDKAYEEPLQEEGFDLIVNLRG